MSNTEIAPESSPYFSYLMPALATGGSLVSSAINPSAIPNYKGSTSKLVGVVRAVAGGIANPAPVVAVQGAQQGVVVGAVPGYGTILLVSTGVPGDDTSQYRVYWTNEVAQSQLITVQSC
jgi:hypothetical protein